MEAAHRKKYAAVPRAPNESRFPLLSIDTRYSDLPSPSSSHSESGASFQCTLNEE